MCAPGCRTPSRSQAHCSECHVTFGGVTGFDQHRRSGSCVDPQELGFLEKSGVWRYPPSERFAKHLAALKQ